MPLVRILKDYGSVEKFQVGEVYDITNVETLVAEGNVEYVTQKAPEPLAPVAPEPITPEEEEPIIDEEGM